MVIESNTLLPSEVTSEDGEVSYRNYTQTAAASSIIQYVNKWPKGKYNLSNVLKASTEVTILKVAY